MQTDRSRLRYLLEKYADNTCSFGEFSECTEYFSEAANNETILEWMQEEWMLITGKELEPSAWEHLYPLAEKKKPVRFGGWWKYAAAAALIICIAGYFILHSQSGKTPEQEYMADRFKNDVPAPTGARTILKLAGGQQIVLDSVQNGKLIRQGNSDIIKTGGNQLIYQTLGKTPAEILYNTLFTAKGGRTSIVLADGSKVWLNALSSLRFPTAFSGKERVVELTGEAYFEVAKNTAMPFKVKAANGMEVQVLGTHFNVMAYDNEPVVKTTLLEGSVRVEKGRADALLKPGEQGILNRQEHISVANANVEQAIAWKNNLFWFDNTDIEAVMRQVSRWYDVDIVFNGKVEKHFTGTLPKDASISTLLKVMELSGGVHFTIEGKRISVME